MKFFTLYNRPPQVDTICDQPSMTRQEFARECDLNCILEDYRITGQLPTTSRVPSYGDFTDVQDFETSLQRVNQAKDDFNALPANMRARFGNDPVAYYSFVLDPKNVEECVRLGLATPHQKKEDAISILRDIRASVTPKGTAEPIAAV